MSRRTDEHTLYVIDNALERKNPEDLKAHISKIVEEGILELQKNYAEIPEIRKERKKTEIGGKFIVNIPVSMKTGIATGFGFGFVWVESPEMYFSFLGKNPDGSDRVEWIPSEEPGEIDFSRSGRTSWGDLGSNEIIMRLPPLITLPNDIIIKPAFVEPPSKGFLHHVFKTVSPVPEWITGNDIKERLSPYASRKTRYPKDVRASPNIRNSGEKGKAKECPSKDSYPIINFNNSRIAFVTWDKGSSDGQFAMLMCHKMEVIKDDRRTILAFCFAKETTRSAKTTRSPRMDYNSRPKRMK